MSAAFFSELYDVSELELFLYTMDCVIQYFQSKP